MIIQHIARPLSIKSLGEDGSFTGYASVFDRVDSQNEIVAPGAFSRTLAAWRQKGGAPAMLWMHDPTIPIGLWISMAEDKNGLAVEGRLALATQKGREAYELLKMRALTGLSIGYRVIHSQVDSKRKARILTDVELFEISLVTFPANEAARVSNVKSPRDAIKRKPARKTRPVKTTKDAEKTREIVAPLYRAASVLKQKSKEKI